MHQGAIILCGGKSSRMGQDKATLPFGPELMLQRVLRLVCHVVGPSNVVIVTAQGQQLPALPHSVIITRDKTPCRGPLEGIAAGLRALPSDIDAAYVTSCDVPLLQPEFVRFMFARLADNQIAVPYDGQFHHPLASVYRPSVLPMIQTQLMQDQLRPRFLFDQVQTVEVPVDELRVVDSKLLTLMNLNHPEDYLAALREAGFES